VTVLLEELGVPNPVTKELRLRLPRRIGDPGFGDEEPPSASAALPGNPTKAPHERVPQAVWQRWRYVLRQAARAAQFAHLKLDFFADYQP
jgi:hypothetical protein